MQTSAHKNLKKFRGNQAGRRGNQVTRKGNQAGRNTLDTQIKYAEKGRTPRHHTAPTEPTPHQLKIKQKPTPHPERE